MVIADPIEQAAAFLAAVLPHVEGEAVLARRAAGSAGGLAHEAFVVGPGCWQAMAQRALSLAAAADVWVCSSILRTGSIDAMGRGRIAANVLALQALRLDIDTGEGKPYPRKREAFAALTEFVEATALPIPVIVDSGNGLHVWWRLTAATAPDDWQPLAERLKSACSALGLAADPSVTADRVRLLRLPGTTNHKHGQGKPVVVKNACGVRSVGCASLEDLDARLRAVLDRCAVSVPQNLRAGAGGLVVPRDLPADVVAAASANPLGVALGAFGPGVSIDDIEAGAQCVTFESVAALCAAKRWPAPDGVRSAWRDYVLLPLRKFALDNSADAARAFAVFTLVSERFGGTFDAIENERQWHATTPTKRDIGSFIIAAQAGGFDLRRVRTARQAAVVATSQATLLERFNAQFAHGSYGSRAVVVYRPNGFDQDGPTEIMSVREFRERHTTRVSRPGGSRDTEANAWLGDPGRRQFRSVVFTPGAIDVGPDINLWRPSPIVPREGDVAPFARFLRMLFRDDETVVRYFIRWLAHAMQRPAEKPGVAVLMTGPEGAGKSVLAHSIGELFGAHYRGAVATRSLAGGFNGEIEDALVGFVDEGALPLDERGMGPIKAAITEPVIRVERKGLDAVLRASYARFIIACNDRHVAAMGPIARRWLVVSVGTEWLNDHARFKAYLRWWREEGGREAVAHALLSLDLSDFNVRARPETAALREQRALSLDPLDRLLREVACSGQIPGSRRSLGSLPFDVWQAGVDQPGFLPTATVRLVLEEAGQRLGAELLSRRLRERLGTGQTVSAPRGWTGLVGRPNGVVIAPRSQFRELVASATGTGADWSDCEAAPEGDDPPR